MKNLLIGRSPLTTLVGLLLAVLTSFHRSASGGLQHWHDWLLPAALALLGRLAGDDGNHPRPPMPMPAPVPPSVLPTREPDFLRRGRMHRQRRLPDGRFAPSTA